MNRFAGVAICLFVCTLATFEVQRATAAPDVGPLQLRALTATTHPPISREASALWLAPTPADIRLTTTPAFTSLK